MDLIEKAASKRKILKYQYNGNYYSQASKKLRRSSAKILNAMEKASRKMKNIDLAADKAYEKAERYYELAEDEKTKSIEN